MCKENVLVANGFNYEDWLGPDVAVAEAENSQLREKSKEH
jgi:hypothetical protein